MYGQVLFREVKVRLDPGMCDTFFFLLFLFTQTLQSWKKLTVCNVLRNEHLSDSFYSLKVMWVTVTVGDHQTLWMPSHLWRCAWLTSQACGEMQNYMLKEGFRRQLALLTLYVNICPNFLGHVCKLRVDWPWIHKRKSENGAMEKA